LHQIRYENALAKKVVTTVATAPRKPEAFTGAAAADAAAGRAHGRPKISNYACKVFLFFGMTSRFVRRKSLVVDKAVKTSLKRRQRK
jgi:hypothetical protein